jgi:hypothetical protein
MRCINSAGGLGSAGKESETGITLVELLLYMSLSVIVLAVAMAMLINSANAQKQVNGATAAASAGQLIIGSVQAGVRNASQVQLTTPGAGTQLLMVRTAGGQTPLQWTCQAWYFTTGGGGTLYTKRIPDTAPIAPPTASTLSSWSVLATGISVAGAQIFTASAGLVTVSLNIDTGKATPIALSSTSNTLNLVTTGTPCF